MNYGLYSFFHPLNLSKTEYYSDTLDEIEGFLDPSVKIPSTFDMLLFLIAGKPNKNEEHGMLCYHYAEECAKRFRDELEQLELIKYYQSRELKRIRRKAKTKQKKMKLEILNLFLPFDIVYCVGGFI